VNRREFAQVLAVVAGAGPVFAGFAEPGVITHFVHDSRLRSSQVTDWVARLQPTHHHMFDRDVTDLWRNVLHEAWRDAHAATAGFTRHAEFFVLSTLARDHGYRVAAIDEQADHLSWLLVRDGSELAGGRDWHPGSG
jgi:hypothetical protein